MTQTRGQTHYRTCNICEAMCGVAIEHDGTQVISIKGDRDDPLSKGHICPKALALKDFHEDPERLRRPIIRGPNGWEEISWNKAYDLVATRLKAAQTAYGKNAIGAYSGNPNVHHHGNMLFNPGFLKSLRTRNRFSATSNDQLPHMRASLEMFGHQLLFPVPDIDHCDLFILVGSNPAASNGSMMTAPDMVGRMKAISKRGGEVILIDPRRTESARAADQHLFIRPASDAFLFLGMLHTLFDEGLIETGRLSNNIDGLETLQALVAAYPASRASELTGIETEVIKGLARKLASTPRACIFGRMGTSTQEFGSLATWLIYVLNTVTNHLDERGGLMFTKPAADLVELGAMSGAKGSVGRYHSENGLPEFGGELPASTMAEQIEQPGPMQIKAMVVIAGNPILSSPNSERLQKAFESLDFMVSIDSYLNETSSLADIILPPTSQLEQSHYDIAFNMLAVRNVAKFSPALFEPAKDAQHDWQIMLELSKRMHDGSLQQRLSNELNYQALSRLGPDGMLDIILRLGPYGTQLPGTEQLGAFMLESLQGFIKPNNALRKLLNLGPYGAANRGLSKGLCVSSLKNYPHGVDLGSLQSQLPERLYTRNKRIKLVPASCEPELERLAERAEQQATLLAPDQLLMIGRRHLRSNNSWLHNSRRFVKGKSRCLALMHPDDAAARKLQDGDELELSSRVGSITIAVKLTSDIMPGVISVPHGWGHDLPGSQMRVANSQPGVNVNRLTDDSLVDQMGGTSALNGVPVTVRAKQANRPPASSSGKTARSSSKAAQPRKRRTRAKAELS